MASIKRLRSVAQSTAHHAVSGMCYLHPHLGEECKRTGTKSARITLVGEDREHNDATDPITLATGALREKFEQILRSEDEHVKEVKSAHVTFAFDLGRWPTASAVELLTLDGKKITSAVGSDGRPAEVLATDS